MSDTPRTDEAFMGDHTVGLLPTVVKFGDALLFARQLERELNEAKQDMLKWANMAGDRTALYGQWRDCATKLYQAATAQQKTESVELFCKLNKDQA